VTEFNTVRMIYPYYENPQMLERQVENWNRYAGDLRDSIRIILVDDGSQKYPAEPIFKHCKAPKRLYRIKQDIPWNQHGARNLGAMQACKSSENFWLYMSDMDIILTPETAYDLFSRKLNPANYYTFERTFLPDCTRRKYHCNTFLVKHSVYWAVGGYDEDYCGTYGGDGPFLRQMNVLAPRVHLPDVLLYGVERDVVADANTDLPRKEGKFGDKYRQIFDDKRKRGDERAKNPLRFDWERVPL
jgi:hypothetical protein